MPVSHVLQIIGQIDLSSRAKRGKAVNLAAALLERVRTAEETNIDNFPLAFRDSDAFANAESSLDGLIDAIVALDDVY